MRKLFILFTFLSVSLIGFAVQICDAPLGHLNDPEFGDLNGRILFSVEPTGNINEYKVTIKPNGGSKKLDYIYIELGNGATTSPYPITAGTDDNGDEFDEMTATFTYTGSTGSMGSIQWSNPEWGGRWGCSYADIDFANLQACGEVCADSEDPTVSDVSVGSISYSSAVLTITASDNVGGSGISQYIVKNGDTQIASSASNVITLTGLTPNTTYNNIKVFAKDGCDNLSSAYNVTSFQTENLIYNQFPTGHLSDPNFGDIYGRILLTIKKVDNATIAVKVEPNNNGTKGIKYLNIIVNGVNHEYGNSDGSGDDLTDFFEIGGLASLNFTFNLFFYCNTPNWTTNQFSVTESQLYSEAPSDTEKPSMADATVTKVSQTQNSVVISITGADDNVDVTQYVVKNHSDDSSVGEYTPAENMITVSGLSPSTSYNWDIYAKDAAGNVSDNSKNITFTTDALVSNYCGETLSNGTASVDMSCEFKNNKYVISFTNPTISGEASTLAGFNGSFCTIGGTGAYDARNYYSVNNSERIVLEFDGEPNFYTDLYINIPANNQRTFNWPNDVVWGSCPTVAVTGVTLNRDELNMQVGGATQTLVATIAPTTATNQNVTWATDDPGVATVENGVVTAIGEGIAHITVTTQDGSFTDQCTVNVTVPSISAATYNGYCTDGNFFVKYAITRTVSRTLNISANIEWLPTYSGVGAEIWRGGDFIGLSNGGSGSTFTGTFLSDLTDGAELNLSFRIVYAGGAKSLDPFSYIVGSEQAVPETIPVGAVVLNTNATTLAVGETEDLSATVYPSFTTSAGSVTWNSNASGYASVDAGTVTAVAAGGSADITATCGGVTSEPCVVTVIASLAEAKFYGTGVFSDNSAEKKAFAYEFCFTRSTDHHVTLEMVFSEDVSGVIANDADFGFYINNVGYHLTYNASTKTATYDFDAQSENAEITYRFRFVMPGGLHETANTTYIVGSSNEKVYACVADEDIDNSAVLAAYDGRTAQVIVDRSFSAGNLYTLVLPFDADADQVAAKLPGALTKLNNTIVKDNGDLRVNFVNAATIEAGVPYLYEPSADVINPVFAGVTISKDLNPSEPDELAKYYGIYAPTKGSALQGISNAYVLGSDLYLYATSGLTNEQPMKALRAYFVLNFPPDPNPMPNRRARIVFNSNETETATGIEDVQGERQSIKVIRDGQLFIIRDGKTYNAQGQLIK